MSKLHNISRRNFLGITTGTVGAAMLGGSALSGWAQNTPKIDLNGLIKENYETDTLVIGGGMAGLFAAVKASDSGVKVIMVSKGQLGSSGATPFAKGIFAYDASKEKLSLDEYVKKISLSAIGTNCNAYTRQTAEHSLEYVKELKKWGFFDSPLYNKSFTKPIEERKIPVIERVTITHLIKENGRIAGAAGFSIDEEKIIFFRAKSVILCTGAGGFKPNGFPICDLTHDGTIMAYDIGAKVTGKEWNDGHPAQSVNAADCYDGWHGMFDRSPGITGVGICHDLGVDLNYQAYMSGNPVSMPGRGGQSENNTIIAGGPYTPEEFKRGGNDKAESKGNEEKNSSATDKGRPGPENEGKGGGEGHGKRPEPGKDRGGNHDKRGGGGPGFGYITGGSSAGMAIHKSEGLVPINDKCESTIPGLYAAGDALGSYMIGGIYAMGGSSLAGSAVQGGVAGKAAAEYAMGIELSVMPQDEKDKIKEEILAPLKRKSGYSPAWVTQTLQGIMIPNFVLYIKSEKMMRAALAYVEELRDHHLPLLRASDLHDLRLAYETKNMIITAEMKLKASLMRTESRCSHYRLDYPNVDYKNWQSWINIFKGEDGTMQFEKQPFNTWPMS